MSVREHPTKPGHWIIDCRPSGYMGKRERLVVQGNTRVQALDIEKSIMRRHVDMPSSATAKTIAAIYPIWISYYKANRAPWSVVNVEGCWNRTLRNAFGKLQPKMLTRSIIEQYKSSRLTAGVKPRTINKEIAFLSGMLKWAQENDLCDPLPFLIKGFPAKMIVSPKPRPLNQEQITMIYNEMPHNLKLAFLLMADAGLRHREALGLKRESVEFTQGVIFVTGKGGKERIVPITTDRLMKELELKKDVTGWLTVNSVTEKPYLTIGVQLNEAVKKAGLDKHVYPHLLRHSFGTNATMADFSLSSLQSIMGHSSVNTTGLYQHLAGEYLRNEGRKLNSMVHNVCPHGKLNIQDK